MIIKSFSHSFICFFILQIHTGTTQRDGMGREEGGGFGMGSARMLVKGGKYLGVKAAVEGNPRAVRVLFLGLDIEAGNS